MGWFNRNIICGSLLMLGQVGAATAATDPDCKIIEDDLQRLSCYDQSSSEEEEQEAQQELPPLTGTVLDYRIRKEAESADNSYALTAHQPSYILPLAYASSPNDAPFDDSTPLVDGDGKQDNLEVKFQISFRVPVNRNFFFKNSHLWFGYTQLSLWQLYNRDASAPFRETNYEPELIWAFLVNRSFGDVKLTHLSAAINHQSNGRSEPLSRSWNRFYINSIWAYENWVLSFRPWIRLPETDGTDDNPDIEDYMGNFDIRLGKKYSDHTFSTMLRSNLDSDRLRNFYELSYSFSINRKFRGYAQFVSGYGESLIDYNHRNRRFSIGIMLNDWF